MSEETPAERLKRILAEEKAAKEAQTKTTTKVKEEIKTIDEAIVSPIQYTPREIVAYLDSFVRGQDKAKRTLALATYQHYLGLSLKETKQDTETGFKLPFGSQHTLLIGNSGCGKSYLVKLLAQLIDVPFFSISAANLVPAGCPHGFSVNDVIESLYMSTNKNLAQTQKAIVFIDEIDKIHLKGDLKHDAFIQGIQDALLTTLDGSLVNISATGHRFMPTSSRIDVDTTGILFICAGAFAGLSEIIQARQSLEGCAARSQHQKNPMGFNLVDKTAIEQATSSEDAQILKQLETKDLVNFGFIPEFIGRFAAISVLDTLSSEDLIEIMVNSQDSILQKKKSLFEFYGIELVITPSALNAIADKALVLNTGVRALTRIINDSLRDIEFQFPELAETGICQITVTEQTLEDTKSFLKTSSLDKVRTL